MQQQEHAGRTSVAVRLHGVAAEKALTPAVVSSPFDRSHRPVAIGILDMLDSASVLSMVALRHVPPVTRIFGDDVHACR